MANILFFDTETSGLPKNYKAPVTDLENWPRLVQFACCSYNGEGEFQSEWESIIKPDNFEIPKAASDVHGITNEIAIKKGINLKLVLYDILDELKAADIIVGHNINFDIKIILAELIRTEIEPNAVTLLEGIPVVCTMESSTNYCAIPGKKFGYKWPTLAELHSKLFGKTFADAHDALADIRATATCFWELVKLHVISIPSINIKEESDFLFIKNDKDIAKYEKLFRQQIIDNNDPFKISTQIKDQNILIHFVQLGSKINVYDQSKILELINEYQNILEKDKTFTDAYFQLAYLDLLLTSRKLSIFDSAIESYNRVLKIEPNNLNALIYKGNLLFSLDFKEATSCFKSALRIDPNCKMAIENFKIAKEALDYCQPSSIKKKQLTEETWHELSKKWKELIIFNINLTEDNIEDYNNNDLWLAYDSHSEDNVLEILEKAIKLKKFLIPCYFNDPNGVVQGTLDQLGDKTKIGKIQSIESLEPIILLENLTSITSEGNCFDLRYLTLLNKLTYLNLSENEQDIRPISNLVNLKELSLSGNKQNLRPLSYLVNLTKLNLEQNRHYISPISNLINLQELNLSEYIFERKDISKLTNLTSLILDESCDSRRRFSLDFLAELVNLKELSLQYNTNNLAPLSNLNKLEKLNLNYNTADLSPLSNLTNLTSLDLEDLSPLADLTNLKMLNLEYNKLDLKPIKNLLNLKYLNLEGNTSDLEPIKELIERIRSNGGTVLGVE